MPETDLALVERCRNGDREAFEDLYHRHAPRLYRLLSRMLGDAAEAEDVLQDVFLVVHRRLQTFKGDSALGTWLYRIAVNRCLDHGRRRRPDTEHLAPHGPDVDELTATRPAGLVTKLDLHRAIARLPEGYRVAFLLHDMEGLAHRDIAQVLGIAEGTSKSQVHKARLRLREFLTARVPASSGPRPGARAARRQAPSGDSPLSERGNLYAQ